MLNFKAHAFLFSCLFYFTGHAVKHVGSYFPDQGLILCPLKWKPRVLNTGPLGKFLFYCKKKKPTKNISGAIHIDKSRKHVYRSLSRGSSRPRDQS